jgi:beta-glucuronidase
VLATLWSLCVAAPAMAAGDPPRPVTLAGGWEFADRAEGPWRGVHVPNVMDPKPTAGTFPGRVGWYRLSFKGPRTPAGHAWGVRFEQVRRRAEVFLNGRRIGTNDDPYTPFTLPASGLRPGAGNTLIVRVDNRRTPGWREGWWNWGGITRAVRLVPRGRVFLADTGLLSEVRCGGVCTANVRLDTKLTNRTDRPVRPEVSVRIAPPGGGPASTKTMRVRTVQPGETARVVFPIPIRGEPDLWAPERPQLYTASVRATLDGTVEHAEQRRIGLRTVTVEDGRLVLNGRRLDVRGASIQEDMPGRGPALTDADIEEIVRELKAVHANVTRAHYLLDERLLRRLDEEGIMVWSQAPVYHRDVFLRDDRLREKELGTVERTVMAARNHPSVITHSVANELSAQPDITPTTVDFLDRARGIVADLDPTVPPSVDVLAWPGFGKQQTYARFPLLGVNSYFGWYQGDPNHETGDLADLEPFLRDFRDKYRDSAMVMTEFGAESTMDGPADVKETYAFQSEYLRDNLDVVRKVGFMSGAIYWTLREFAVKNDWDGGAERKGVARDAIHNKGLLRYADAWRKPAWTVASRDFARTPLYESPPSRAVEAATSEGPKASENGPLSAALVAGVIGLLLTFAGVLVLCFRDVWRFAGRPEEPDPAEWADDPDRERHLELVA